MSKEELAKELLKAILSNPAYIEMGHEPMVYVQTAISYAELLKQELGE